MILTTTFDIGARLAEIDAILSREPELSRLERPEFNGDTVARFVLPLDLCKPQNAKRGSPVWAAMADRKKLAKLMFIQQRPVESPLPGRPQVLCLRLSSSEPDRYSDWMKTAVDVLCPPNKRCTERLNMIHDDAPKYADVISWWEPAKKGHGFCYIELRTGK